MVENRRKKDKNMKEVKTVKATKSQKIDNHLIL